MDIGLFAPRRLTFVSEQTIHGSQVWRPCLFLIDELANACWQAANEAALLPAPDERREDEISERAS